MNPDTREEGFYPNYVDYIHGDHQGLLTIDGTVSSHPVKDSTLRLPKAFLEDTLYSFAELILTDDFAAQDESTQFAALDRIWQEAFKGIKRSDTGCLEYTPSAREKQELSPRDTWVNDEDGLYFEVKGGMHLWKPITNTQKTLEQDFDSEKIAFAPNLKYGFDPKIERYRFTVRPEAVLESERLPFSDSARVACRREDQEELIKLCSRTITDILSRDSFARDQLRLKNTERLTMALVDAGSALLQSKDLHFADFDTAGVAVEDIDLGDCGQNVQIATREDTLKRSQELLQTLFDPRFIRPMMDATITAINKQKTTCESLIEDLLSKKPDTTSYAAWSEVIDRAVKLVKKTMDGMMVMTDKATEWELDARAELVKGDLDSALKYRFGCRPEVLPSDYFQPPADGESANVLRLTVRRDIRQSKDGPRTSTSTRFITVDSRTANDVLHLAKDGWRVKSALEMYSMFVIA